MNSDTVVSLDEPKKKFDWQDVIDLMDEVGRHIDGLKDESARLEYDKRHLILLLDIKGKHINSLKEANKNLMLELAWKERE